MAFQWLSSMIHPLNKHIARCANVFTTCTTILLFGDFLERRYASQIRSAVTNVSFSALHMYSKLQIYFTKMNKTLHEYTNTNPVMCKLRRMLENVFTKKHMKNGVHFIKDGKQITNVPSEMQKVDFVIYSYAKDNQKWVHKRIVHDVHEMMDEAECSNIKFILVEIKAGDFVYKIDLKTDAYNFYLVGNKFNKPFFIYYLISHLNADEQILREPYFKITMIDHEANLFQMDFIDNKTGIVLNKSSYKIE